MTDLLNSYLFRVIFIPAGVFVSVMFGGGASTGLEITTYMTSNGPVGGLVAIGLIALLYSTIIFLCYEIARLYRTYDYQSFSKITLGPKAWILYEVCIVLAMFGVMAYSTTGGGTAMADYFGVSRFAVTAVILVVVVFLTYRGRRLVEMTMVATTLLLLGSALWLVMGAYVKHGAEIAVQLQDTSMDFFGLLKQAMFYSVVVMSYVPIILYATRDLRTRGETLAASVASGFAIMLPPLGMHLSYLSHYPAILEQQIPNAWIAEKVLPGFFSGFFVIVLNIVILQTAVGILQGIIERLEAWNLRARNEVLSKKSHATIAAVCLVLCLGLSSYGVQKLLGWMYGISFWLFLFVFFLPLLTVGIYRIWMSDNQPTTEPTPSNA